MSVLNYDVSWRIKSITTKKDKFINLYNKNLSGKKISYIEEAISIYGNSSFKLILECMLLCNFPKDECIEYFGCEEKTIDFYKKMFFDIDPVRHSKAKLLSIAYEGNPNEINLKISTIKLGEEFLKWYLGLKKTLDPNFEEILQERINNGLIIKSIGHEFVNATSSEMNTYLRIISTTNKKDTRENTSKDIEAIIGHFAKAFSNPNEKNIDSDINIE